MEHKYHFGYSKKFSEKWQEIFKAQSNNFSNVADTKLERRNFEKEAVLDWMRESIKGFYKDVIY